MPTMDPKRLDVRDYIQAFWQAHLILFGAPLRFGPSAAILLMTFIAPLAGLAGTLATPALIACIFVMNLIFAWAVDRRQQNDAPGLMSAFQDSWTLLVFTLRRPSWLMLFLMMVGSSVLVAAIVLRPAPLPDDWLASGSEISIYDGSAWAIVRQATLAAPVLVIGFCSWVGLIGAGARILLRQLRDAEGADWLWIAGERANNPLGKHMDLLLFMFLFSVTVLTVALGAGWAGALYFALLYPVWIYVLFRMIYLGQAGCRKEVKRLSASAAMAEQL